jgi:N-acyl-D-aspartate/D-glutamate deacylase
MLDYLIKNGTIIDGTGSPPTIGDVGISGGRIVSVGGAATDDAETVIDASGLMVTPGFIDPHTHYDAQLNWDGSASPSNLHGVTTVISGNCGFTLAPVRPADADYTLRMLSVVEGMSLEALREGVEWRWETFGEFLDSLEGRVGVNAGFMVGHCALRQYVMGESAVGSPATPEQIERIVEVLHASIEAGGLGLSTTRARSHFDDLDRPVSSRSASPEEVIALCAAVGQHPGTTLEAAFDGGIAGFSEQEIELIVDMVKASHRPLNWNVLQVSSADLPRVRQQMSLTDRAAEFGENVTALTMPVPVPMTQSLLHHCALRYLPGLGELYKLPVEERIEILSDPVRRDRMAKEADAPEAGQLRQFADFGQYLIGDTYCTENKKYEGRLVRDIAAERGVEPFTAMVEIALRDQLRTVLWPVAVSSDADWELRRRAWRSEGVLIGGSDAGAHLDRMCGAPYTTTFLADVLRGTRLIPIEEAVYQITAAPADFYRLAERGRLLPGYHADVVVFDPRTVGAGPAHFAADLPGGAKRLFAASTGVNRVLVRGVETLVDGKSTGALPGAIIRSGTGTR